MDRQRQTGNIYTDLQLQFYPRTTETCELQQTIIQHTHVTSQAVFRHHHHHIFVYSVVVARNSSRKIKYSKA